MKILKGLSLLLSGVVLGIGISFSPQIYAATSELLGSTVTSIFTIEQNGVKIADSAIINGSAYVPVRVMAEATGTPLTVEGKVITLGEDSTTVLTPEQNTALAKQQDDEAKAETARLNNLYKEQRTIEKNIEKAKQTISLSTSTAYTRLLDKIKLYEERVSLYPELTELVGELENYKKDLSTMEKSIADAKASLPILQKQLADLLASEPGLSMFKVQ